MKIEYGLPQGRPHLVSHKTTPGSPRALRDNVLRSIDVEQTVYAVIISSKYLETYNNSHRVSFTSLLLLCTP